MQMSPERRSHARRRTCSHTTKRRLRAVSSLCTSISMCKPPGRLERDVPLSEAEMDSELQFVFALMFGTSCAETAKHRQRLSRSKSVIVRKGPYCLSCPHHLNNMVRIFAYTVQPSIPFHYLPHSPLSSARSFHRSPPILNTSRADPNHIEH